MRRHWFRHEWADWGLQDSHQIRWQRCPCGARRIYEPKTGYSYGRWHESEAQA